VWFPVDSDTWAIYMEASLNMGDWITNMAYFSVVSICAPIWEEVRGCPALSCHANGVGAATLNGFPPSVAAALPRAPGPRCRLP
jgi:hypothetical protein